jgi:hypothetical protein
VTVGKYDILISHFGFVQEYYDIQLTEEPNRIRLILPCGSLKIDTLLNGQMTDVPMQVFLPDDRVNPVFMGSSSEKVVLPPGEYDIRFLLQGNEDWLEGIRINNGDNLVQEHQVKIRGI